MSIDRFKTKSLEKDLPQTVRLRVQQGAKVRILDKFRTLPPFSLVFVWSCSGKAKTTSVIALTKHGVFESDSELCIGHGAGHTPRGARVVGRIGRSYFNKNMCDQRRGICEKLLRLSLLNRIMTLFGRSVVGPTAFRRELCTEFSLVFCLFF